MDQTKPRNLSNDPSGMSYDRDSAASGLADPETTAMADAGSSRGGKSAGGGRQAGAKGRQARAAAAPKSAGKPRRQAGAAPAVQQPAATEQPPAGPGRSQRSTGRRQRSFYLPDDVYLRSRNTWWWTQNRPGGLQSHSKLVEVALLGLIEALEAELNDGQPFPPAPDEVHKGPTPEGSARQAAAMRAYWKDRLASAANDADETAKRSKPKT